MFEATGHVTSDNVAHNDIRRSGQGRLQVQAYTTCIQIVTGGEQKMKLTGPVRMFFDRFTIKVTT